MKFIFSPLGLALLLLVALILFFPRRTPDRIRRAGRPMRAFADEPSPVDEAPQTADPSDKTPESRDDT